ncbi:efflux RND transporter periplasmic adaptor subunit [Pedobacter sp. KBS0701]|uniref:efflux RND transporter periplasmic adaptor subunit n=1 Tax=Pedobacter sp. KBS0701 TaxID=2578106 RepID=UPI00110D8675|nr:efflux RND transporter periplasmic adaptor subunit [Pedobacter sp. KBS0701]QDW26223.1 efflux RND transporter periplasmic adaptor subunit [Pedobacter sp. KBS0701]
MKIQILAGLVCMSLLLACNGADEKETVRAEKPATTNTDEVQLTDAQAKNAGILIGKIEQKTMHSIINVNGVVDVPPENTYSVSVPMGGYIKKMIIMPGMLVKKGAVLALVEDQQYIQLQQDYLTSGNRLKFLAADYTRQKGLNQTKATSDKIFQQIESDYNNQKVLVKALAQKLRLIGVNPENLNENSITRNIKIYAPISGYVTKVNVNTGKFVNATDILFELISPGELHANLTVFERDAASLKTGQEVICNTTANPEKKYIAKIHLITPNIEDDRTTSVHCDIQNSDNKLLPGTFLNAAISIGKAKVNVLSEDAIVKWENKYYIFEEVGNKLYKMVPIEIGTALNGFIEIKTNKKLGNVVTKNAYAILMKMKNGGEEG